MGFLKLELPVADSTDVVQGTNVLLCNHEKLDYQKTRLSELLLSEYLGIRNRNDLYLINRYSITGYN
jgi:hypothetical protein